MKTLLLGIVLAIVGLHAQTTYSLQVPSGAVNPGTVVIATVNIATAGAIKPAAVQLRLNYAAADISAVAATIGAAGTEGAKTVSCNGPVPGVYKCIVSGVNTNLIGDGVLLTYAITIAPNTTKTNTAISLSDDLGATVAADVILIADVPFVTVVLVPSRCDLNNDGVVNAADVQLALDQALEKTACAAADLDKDGRCTVNDVQRVINAVLGQGCRVN